MRSYDQRELDADLEQRLLSELGRHEDDGPGVERRRGRRAEGSAGVGGAVAAQLLFQAHLALQAPVAGAETDAAAAAAGTAVARRGQQQRRLRLTALADAGAGRAADGHRRRVGAHLGQRHGARRVPARTAGRRVQHLRVRTHTKVISISIGFIVRLAAVVLLLA